MSQKLEKAHAAQAKVIAAKEAARALAQEAAAEAEAQRFEDWKRLQEEAGYTVEGDSFATARVVELPDGPTYDERTGV